MNKQRVVERLIEYLTEELLVEQAEARQSELRAQLQMYRFLPKRIYSHDDLVVPSVLVTLKTGSVEAYYFVVPQGGGLITDVDGKPLQVITPHSPLGEKLLGKKVGDAFEVELRNGVRHYEVTSIS